MDSRSISRTAADGHASSDAWRNRACDLTAWTLARLVHRTDAWGAYRAEGGQYTRRGKLNGRRLMGHYRATDGGHIIGLHSADADNRGRWAAIDIDQHGDDADRAAANLHAAQHWYAVLAARGHRPLLTGSNGAGGYHLRILLAEDIDAARLYHFVRELTADYRAAGLDARPETYPKQLDVRRCSKGLGSWLRLPGRHHRRPYWSEVWAGSRWLAGHDAIDLLLSLTGDDPGLIPAIPEETQRQGRRATTLRGRAGTGALSRRIERYMARLPHLAEGQGRDGVAYSFAAWLVRDMALPDDSAADWLARWDAGNTPPKGRDRLVEILASAHAYGRRPYGSGLTSAASRNGTHQGGHPDDAEAGGGEPTLTMVETLAAHLRSLRPLHRRGETVYADAAGEYLDLRRAGVGPSTPLLARMEEAIDCPRDKEGVPSIPGLLRVWRQYLAVAWADLLAELPEEADCPEIAAGSEDELRRQLAVLLGRVVTCGRVIHDGDSSFEVQESRSLVHWCLLVADCGQWARIRSWHVWCQLSDGAPLPVLRNLPAAQVQERLRERIARLRVALRIELAGQLGIRPLADWTPRRLTGLVEHYGLGRALRIGHARARAIEVAPAYLADLLGDPETDPSTAEEA